MDSQCAVCGTPHRLGTMTLPGDVELTVCVWCHEDKKRVRDWLAAEMEKALEADPNAERQPDGTWKFLDAPPRPAGQGSR